MYFNRQRITSGQKQHTTSSKTTVVATSSSVAWYILNNLVQRVTQYKRSVVVVSSDGTFNAASEKKNYAILQITQLASFLQYFFLLNILLISAAVFNNISYFKQIGFLHWHLLQNVNPHVILTRDALLRQLCQTKIFATIC